jgi:hypothetical protein
MMNKFQEEPIAAPPLQEKESIIIVRVNTTFTEDEISPEQ